MSDKKKFNWKSKTFISGFIALILTGFGIANPAVISTAATTAICSVTTCDA